MTGRQLLTPAAIRRLTLVTDPWLSCDDCFDDGDAVVEEVLAGRGAISEPFRVHLLSCSVCREEAEALVSLVATERGVPTASAALADLDRAVHGAAGRS
jgi:hypothetical protein